MKKNCYYLFLWIACFLIDNQLIIAQISIPSNFYGINAWMPDTIATTYYAGKLHQHWAKIKTAQTRMLRLGGIAPDEHFYTTYQLLKMVDSVRAAGAEPIIQVPLWANTFTAANAANIIHNLNVVHAKNIQYVSIGNEANLVYNSASHGFTSGSYTPAMYASAVKDFSTAIKAIDANVKIIAGELAWYDYTWVNSLFDTSNPSNDITGVDAVSGRNYVDYFSFHYYPFNGSQTRVQVTNAITGLQASLTHLAGKLTTANAFHPNRTTPLQWAMTEVNIDWQNPVGDNVSGVGANSFLAGQFWAEIAATVIKNNGKFINYWSVVEGGDASVTNIGFLSHTTGKKKPIYHHFSLMANYLQGQYYPATSNQSLVRVFATKDASLGWAILLLNYDEVNDFPVSVQLSNNPTSPNNTLNVNVNGGINKTITETLPKNSSLLLFLSPNGHYLSKISYQLSDAQLENAPLYTAYQPVRNKKVFAHYLPWYNTNLAGANIREGWANPLLNVNDTNNVQVTYKPIIGEYSQLDREVLRYHIRTAQAARIDGFIVNVNPVSAFQWKVFSMLCEEVLHVKNECPSKDFVIMISYDNNDTIASNIQSYFTQVRDSFYNKAAFSSLVFKDEITQQAILQVWSDSNVPQYQQAIETVFGIDNVLCFSRNATQFNHTQANFAWIGYLTNDPNNNTNWGNAYYNDFHWIMARQSEFGLTNLRSANLLQFGSVYPGFDDHNVPAYWNGGNDRFIQRNVTAGEVMNLTWDIAQNYSPLSLGGQIAVTQPYVQIATWNDFPEGTSIEPSNANGYKYKALQTNRNRIAQWKGISTSASDTLGIYAPYWIYQAIKEGRTGDATNALTLFCNEQYEQAITTAKNINFPAELVDFQGNVSPTQHFLSWKTLTEQKLSHFELEYSLDGLVFEKIAAVNALGNSTNVHTYQYVNEVGASAAPTVYHYRLKIIDIDGQMAYSDVITLRSSVSLQQQLIVFPNPFGDELFLSWLGEKKNPFLLSIYNEMGQLMEQKVVEAAELAQPLPISFHTQAKGWYFLRLSGENVREQIKVWKQ
ncbi:MAG: T9SS type A sorting domain-containing protein [Bacteroidia bacterium]